MIDSGLVSARRKCSLLANEIVVLRQSDVGLITQGLIALRQGELDLLIARIAETYDVENGLKAATD